MADEESRLPEGWQVEGLFHYDDRGMVENTSPTDAEIMAADSIIVSHTDALGKDYLTIHGPMDTYEDLEAHIEDVFLDPEYGG